MATTSPTASFVSAHPGLVVGLIIALPVIFVLYGVLTDPLRDVPGPLLPRVTRLWELYKQLGADMERVNVDLHKKYGPVVRLGPKRYSIDDPVANKVIYGYSPKWAKAPYYSAFGEPHRTNLFTERDIVKHKEGRQKVTSLYSMGNMLSYEQYVDKTLNLLSERLTTFADKRQIVDLPKWMQFYAFDVVGEITVGKSFGMLERGYDSMDILASIVATNKLSCKIALMPETYPWIAWVGALLRIRPPVQSLVDFTKYYINERKTGKSSTDREDFLAKGFALLADSKITDYDMYTAIITNIAAGSNTTSSTLTSIFYFLLRNPRCMQKLRNEVEKREREGTLSDPVRYSEAQEMVYLQAVIKESLRVQPSTGMIFPRVVPDGGAQLAGYYFPPGSVVGANPYVIHYNKDVFGDDADEFRPERWLGEDKERVKLMNENFFGFGQGSRACLGRNISLLEMCKAIPQLLRKFNFEDVDPNVKTSWKTTNYWFVLQKYECRITPRS